MAYRQFSIRRARQDFNLVIHEGKRFLPEVEPIEPSPLLKAFLEESLPIAIATGREKARSEAPLFIQFCSKCGDILTEALAFFLKKILQLILKLG